MFVGAARGKRTASARGCSPSQEASRAGLCPHSLGLQGAHLIFDSFLIPVFNASYVRACRSQCLIGAVLYRHAHTASVALASCLWFPFSSPLAPLPILGLSSASAALYKWKLLSYINENKQSFDKSLHAYTLHSRPRVRARNRKE